MFLDTRVRGAFGGTWRGIARCRLPRQRINVRGKGAGVSGAGGTTGTGPEAEQGGVAGVRGATYHEVTCTTRTRAERIHVDFTEFLE